jgi:manganese transport protein
VGVAFGLAEVRPVPAIILAQALNGVLLPFAAIFLLLAVNDRRLLDERALNGAVSNVLMGLVTAVTVLLGVSGVVRAAFAAVGAGAPPEGVVLGVALGTVVLLVVPVARAVGRRRRAHPATPVATPDAGG